MLDKTSAKKHIEAFIKFHILWDEVHEEQAKMFGFDDQAPFFNKMGRIHQNYLEHIQELIGDKEDWVGWFLFENDCGEKGYEVSWKNRNGETELRNVHSIDDLLDVIYG